MPPKKIVGPGQVRKKPVKGGYQMPEPLTKGSILTDISKHQWKIGPSIGKGGFGEIYSACKAGSAPKKIDDYPFVVKIEPHDNGPLFVEMHFYMRNAKLEDIEAFRKAKGLSSLGMPHFVSSGSHEINSIKHRFVVMPRYGKDVSKFWLENGNMLPQHTTYRLAIQMLDVLEYIHKCTYVHGDLKAANILLGHGKGGASQAYLVDFGLACHSTVAVDFKPDPKKMHNGTIEYTSRDAHCGVPTMRGDLEILAYNLVHWWGGTLPWINIVNNPVKVHESKKSFMASIESSLQDSISNSSMPIYNFFKYIETLKFKDTPDYSKCRKYFEAGLKSLGKSKSGILDVQKLSSTTPKKTTSPKTTIKPVASKKAIVSQDSSDIDDVPSPIRSKNNKNNGAEVKIGRAITPSRRKKDIPESRKRGGLVDSDTSIEILPKKKNRGVLTPQTTNKSEGSMVINNDILSRGKKKEKTYEINFELDVSIDANVVINVKRKKKQSPPARKPLSQETIVKKEQLDSDEEIQASPNNSPIASMRVQKRQPRTHTVGTRKSPRS